jgi:hypothetical protein
MTDVLEINNIETQVIEIVEKGPAGPRGEAGTTDHGQLTGLADDDHAQYHNDARALTFLGTRSTTDLPEGDNEYYTDFKVDARITAQKGQASGLATLDGSSKIPSSQLPAIAVTDVFVVNSQAAQLALSAEEGDVAVRTDQNKSYIHNGGTAGTMSDWQEMLTPTDLVISVNGQTGAVSLTTNDITEGGSNLYYTNTRADARIAAAVGVSVQAYDANTVKSNVVTSYSKQQYAAEASLTSSSGHIAWNLDNAQAAVHTATESTQLDNPTNMHAGAWYSFRFIQHASAAKNLTFGSAYKWPGGVVPTQSNGASAVDIYVFYCDGTNMHGVVQQGFA